jgi:capsular exopolysaccharide synthesis family protein
MDPSAYLTAIRRRWPIVVATVGIAVILASLTASFTTDQEGGEYQAEALLLGTPLGANITRTEHIGTLAVLTTNGPVPERVADSIGYEGNPRDLTANVIVTPSANLGFLSIRATSADPERAELIAHAFADELTEYVSENKVESALGAAREVARQMRRTARQIDDIERRLQTTSDPVLVAERDAKIRAYGSLAEQRQTLSTSAFTQSSVSVIDKGPAQTISAANAVSLSNPVTRILLGTVLGLIAGMALAIGLDRFDTRIRTRKAAEAHYSYPILAEIPEAPRKARGERAVVAAAHPSSPFATAFRLLATGLTGRLPADGALESEDQMVALQPPQTILVTSAAAGEGKTTVTANLAASFAEQGKKTLILSCDFRNPHIHRMFGVPNDKGLGEALKSQHDGRILVDGHVKKTSIKEIRVVPSSTGPDNPGGLLGSGNMQQVLQEARENADVVLLDTPPILTGSEAAFLFPEVDAVLVVARVGTTTVELAERTSELLKRLGTPVIGVALNSSAGMGAPRHNYREPESIAHGPDKRADKKVEDPAAVKASSRSDRPDAPATSSGKANPGPGSKESIKSPSAAGKARTSQPPATGSKRPASTSAKGTNDTARLGKSQHTEGSEEMKWEL